VSAASLAMVDESSGDLTIEAGTYELIFEHGDGQTLRFDAVISGRTQVLEKFPEGAH